MIHTKTKTVIYKGRKYYMRGTCWYDDETNFKVPNSVETYLNSIDPHDQPTKKPLLSKSEEQERKKALKDYKGLVASDKNDNPGKNDIYGNFIRVPGDRYRQ